MRNYPKGNALVRARRIVRRRKARAHALKVIGRSARVGAVLLLPLGLMGCPNPNSGNGGDDGRGPPPPPPPQQQRPAPQVPVLPDTLQPPLKVPLSASVRQWRAAAWERDDVFAQIRLGSYYAHDPSAHDPVEAYVWYYLALRRDQNYEPHGRAADQTWNRLSESASDDFCAVYDAMSLDERMEARARLIYVLANRGPEGFITLGLLHRENGRYRDRDVIVRNDADALTYFQIAHDMGHPLAAAYVQQLSNALPDKIAQAAIARATYWRPEDEFYPGQTAGGVLHSDERIETIDDRVALERVNEIPTDCLRRALWMSGATVLPAGKSIPPGADRAAAARFQESIGDDPTGSLTPEQIVRLVQTAAVNGDATSQTELGVMYTQGIGVPVNYNRAQHWFEAARRQRYGLAMAYLGHLLERPHPGVTGDNNRALALFGEARSAGYDPGRYALTIRDDRDDRDRGDRRRDRGDRDAREESGNDPAPRSDSDGAAQ